MAFCFKYISSTVSNPEFSAVSGIIIYTVSDTHTHTHGCLPLLITEETNTTPNSTHERNTKPFQNRDPVVLYSVEARFVFYRRVLAIHTFSRPAAPPWTAYCTKVLNHYRISSCPHSCRNTMLQKYSITYNKDFSILEPSFVLHFLNSKVQMQ